MHRVLLGGLLVLAGISLAVPGVAAERFALIVGSNHGGAGASTLYFAETDAERVAEVLVHLGGVPESQLTLLRSPTPAMLEAAMERLADRVADAKLRPGGHATVFFYFSGHALPDAIQLGRQELPFSRLRRDLDATGADVRLLLIDSCHAGAARREKGATRAPGFLQAEAEVDARGEILITSSSADELSQESDEVGGSYFTHYLLSGLRGAADSSGDGQVTLDEAYRYVYHRTVAHTAGTRAGTQHPGFEYDLRGSGDLVLTRLVSRGAVLSFDDRQSGRFLIFDEDEQRFVAEVQVLPGRPSRLMVEAGSYRVQKRSPDALYESQFSLRAGQEVAVDAEAMRAIPYSEDGTKGAVLRARRWASGREIAINGRFGVQAFLDKATRESLIPVMPMFGLELDVRGFLGPFVSLRVDAQVGTSESEPAPNAPARVVVFHGGIGSFLTPRIPGAPSVRPYFGLRIGGIYVHRSFLPPLDQEPEHYGAPVPGAALGLTIAPMRHLRLGLEGRINIFKYAPDDGTEPRDLGYFEGIFTVGLAL